MYVCCLKNKIIFVIACIHGLVEMFDHTIPCVYLQLFLLCLYHVSAH